VLRPKPVGCDDFFAARSRRPDDFLADREQELPQQRDWTDAPDA
jgi:antitoxin VapB